MRFLFLFIGSFFLVRMISGFDFVQNNSKFLYIKNDRLAKILLSKCVGYRNTRRVRSKDDFNKMTYWGLGSYIYLSIVLILYICFNFFVSPIYLDWNVTITLDENTLVNTFKEIFPMLLLFSVDAVVIAYSLFMEYKLKSGGRVARFLYYTMFVIFGVCEFVLLSLIVKLIISC